MSSETTTPAADAAPEVAANENPAPAETAAAAPEAEAPAADSAPAADEKETILADLRADLALLKAKFLAVEASIEEELKTIF